MRKGLCFLVAARQPRRVGLYLAMPSSQRKRHKLEVNGFFGKELERATSADLENSKAMTIETYLLKTMLNL